MPINSAIIDFLHELKRNNNRDWFNENKPRFQEIQLEAKAFYEEIKQGLLQFDEIENFKMFRIYRDVRFSKDKTPYKTHFGRSFHRAKPKLRGGYYLHLAPNNESFIATGFWEPNKDDLFRIRKEFEMDDQEIRCILSNKKFRRHWRFWSNYDQR